MAAKYPTNVKRDQIGAPKPPGSPSGSQGRPGSPANDNPSGPMEIKLPPLTPETIQAIGGLTPPGRVMNMIITAAEIFGVDLKRGGKPMPRGTVDTRYWAIDWAAAAPVDSHFGPALGRALRAQNNVSGPQYSYSNTQLGWALNTTASRIQVGQEFLHTPGHVINVNDPGPYKQAWSVQYRVINNPPFPYPVADRRIQPVPDGAPLVFPKNSPLIEPATFPRPNRPRPNEEPIVRPVPSAPPFYDLPPDLPPLISSPNAPVLVQVPTTIIDVGVGGVTVTRVPGRPLNRKPPARKQDKTNVAIVGGAIWTGINTATEAIDFVQAMYKALPDDKKLSGAPSKSQILHYMAENPSVWKDIPIAEAVQEYINMQVSDWVAAFGSDAIKRVYKDMGSITGLDRAIREAGDAWGDAMGDNIGKHVPELDIDAETGTVRLVFK